MKNILVIMPFSEDWSNKIWESIAEIQYKDVQNEFLINRVDTSKLIENDLDKQVEFYNRSADIILADLTGNNPNVLIEVGMAIALNTPILFLTQDRQSTPAHLKGKIIEEYNPLKIESIEQLKSLIYLRIKELIRRISAEEKVIESKQIYEVNCYSRRELIGLEKYFSNAKNRIDILTTNLSFLFEEFSDNETCYFDNICNAISNNKTKVRILTLDPESDFAAKRGRQLGYSPRVFRNALRHALKKTQEVKTENNYEDEEIEIRTYEDFPNQIMYRIDDDIFSCVVAQPTQSRNSVTFKLNRKQAGANNSFTNHFLNVWKYAQKVQDS